MYQYPRSQWKSLRSTNGLERLNLEFRRRVKTQGSLPSEAAVLALLFGLVATGQIVFRKLDGWQDMATALTPPRPTRGRGGLNPDAAGIAIARLAQDRDLSPGQYYAIP